MINNINNNSYNKDTYSKLDVKPIDVTLHTENDLLPEDNIKDSPKEEQGKLNKVQSEEVPSFLKKIKEEMQDAELIAIKMVKGEKITREELRLINTRYPDIKKTAEQSIKEYTDLKEVLKNCNTEEERQQVISSAIKNIKSMLSRGSISDIQAKIKISAVEEALKSSKKFQSELKKAEVIAIKIVKGSKPTADELRFINEKYPDIKRVAEKVESEQIYLKEELKGCKTDNERQKLISNAIRDVEDKSKAGLISKTEAKIKMSAMEEVIKLSKNIKKEEHRSDLIATKILKGDKLTKNELRFINEKYPDIKKIAQKSIDHYRDLREEIINCKTSKDRQQVLSNVIEDLEYKFKKGIVSQSELKIAMIIIEELKKDDERINNNHKDPKLILNPYAYLNSGSFLEKLIAIVIILVAVNIFLRFL